MDIELKKADQLHFDTQNPRLVEFKQTNNEDELLNLLWKNMAVDELVLSILANGFFQHEPIYIVRENGKYIVVEGNRRLAAVKAILHPDSIDNGGMKKYESRITPTLREHLSNSIPTVELKNREEAWRYIGFKHVNGAAKWDSYAKAEYISQVHNKYGVELADIASQIGDSNQTTQKLYMGLMVLNQADRMTEFKKNDVYYNRIYFSHVYTAIMYASMQEYLGLNLNIVSENPVPNEKLPQLQEVMIWLLGSKKSDTEPVVKSQNPGVRQLCQVLSNKEATQHLRVHQDLEAAYDWSRAGEDILSESIVEAKASVQKALSKVGAYDGGIEILRSAMDLANQADLLFRTLKNARKDDLQDGKTIRTID